MFFPRVHLSGRTKGSNVELAAAIIMEIWKLFQVVFFPSLVIVADS